MLFGIVFSSEDLGMLAHNSGAPEIHLQSSSVSHCGLHLSGKREASAAISHVFVIGIDGGGSSTASQQQPDLLRGFG